MFPICVNYIILNSTVVWTDYRFYSSNFFFPEALNRKYKAIAYMVHVVIECPLNGKKSKVKKSDIRSPLTYPPTYIRCHQIQLYISTYLVYLLTQKSDVLSAPIS